MYFLRKLSLSVAIITAVFFTTGCPLPQIPKPDPAGPATIPSPEDSTVQVSVTADLGSLQAQLDSLVPRVIVEDDGHDCTEYGVYKRAAVALAANGNMIRTKVGIEYRFKGYGINHKPVCLLSVSCGYGEPNPRADVIAASSLTWNANWHLDSQTNTSVDMLDACNLSALNIDVRQKIKDLMGPKLQEISRTIDQRVPQVTNVRPAAVTGWKTLQRPISLGPNLWMLVHPMVPRVSPLNGSGSQMTLSVGLVAKPQIFIQGQAPPATQGDLPPLQLVPASNRFHIALDGHLSYQSATSLAAAALVGQEFKFGRYKVKIKEARVFGSDRRLVLELTVTGSVKGTVYLIGTPEYVSDAQGERIIVPDLDFTVATVACL